MKRERYYRKPALEAIARQTLTRLDPFYLNLAPQAVPLERIVEDIFKLDIEYMRLTEAGDELGRMIYDDGYTTRFNTETDNYELVEVRAGTILIESLLLAEPKLYGRYRFTLAHELAHWILHKNLYTGTRIAAATDGADGNAGDSVEWQATYLGKAILMPVGQIKFAFYKLWAEKGTQKGRIEKIADIFEVSRQAMEIRLTELGLIQ